MNSDTHRSPDDGSDSGAETPFTLVAADRASLLAAASATEQRFGIQRIFEADGIRIIRIAFAAGQAMREHSANAPIVVQVLAGEIVFAVAGEALELSEGSVIHVRAREVHELTARTDADVLLTMYG